MARRSVLSFLCLLYFANSCMDYSLCAFYNNYYEEYGLESEKLCHILGKVSTIDIKIGAAIVRPKYMLDRWNVRANVHCKFKFITAKGYGLFGVIQKMSFRKNGTQCLDYVQIYAEYDPSNHKSNAELETEIFISKEKLEEGEFLAIRIAYTTFGNCSNVGYKRYKLIGHDTCLLNEYFCDGVYNCIPGICSDENNCTHEITSSGTGTNVTIGAVSSLILCFIIFIVCLWICKRSQKLCWSIDCADSNVCSRPEPLSRDTEGSVNPSVPSAPMLEVAVPSSVADKDLPPSYDSLFPEQSNPARS
ncbi:uncharacterized protein LOC100741954 isoform X2 [Bombus impatiens]|uniref:Uncharacterized protein LOC100741954 isoform X2 n=1 Tax=Bombus impatiens TaxID=132113 RepID=A0A6P8LJT0_BOMIM|nr:uncharacterized protein LOC100741954 isoform X2 [Bombus impatiens]